MLHKDEVVNECFLFSAGIIERCSVGEDGNDGGNVKVECVSYV